MRDSNWRAFGRWMTTKDWAPVMEKTSCEDKFQHFLSELKEAIDIYLPEKTVTIHQNDRPWMTKELKLMIKQEWYHQFLGEDADAKALANKINDMFLFHRTFHHYHGKTKKSTSLWNFLFLYKRFNFH